MAKAKTRSKSSRSRRRMGNSHRSRRHNPYGFSMSGRHRKSHRARRRSNPGGFNVRDVGSQLLWGTAGGVAALSIPGLVASTYNTGWTGYLLNGATAYAGSMLVGKMAGPKAGQDFFVGGLVATGLRIFNNFFGSSFPVGLSGLGFYIPNSFPLPTTGSGPFLLNSGFESGSPMPSIQMGGMSASTAALAQVPPSAVQSGDEPSRWSKWAA